MSFLTLSRRAGQPTEPFQRGRDRMAGAHLVLFCPLRLSKTADLLPRALSLASPTILHSPAHALRKLHVQRLSATSFRRHSWLRITDDVRTKGRALLNSSVSSLKFATHPLISHPPHFRVARRLSHFATGPFLSPQPPLISLHLLIISPTPFFAKIQYTISYIYIPAYARLSMMHLWEPPE
jgi:hypothetical protein